jgi:hypothetical protein
MKTTKKTTTSKIENYIKTSKFKNHKSNVIFKFDRNHLYIDDVIQDFCLYYLERPHKKPNIRKLYNIMIDYLRKNKKLIKFDVDELIETAETIEDYDFQNILKKMIVE